ncbi:acyl-CoA thioesterase [Chryseobacterium chendengshani]|uniref:acyl-CoA thioesterase n=1 Tax=unclassified Chryseobacterium TaxID=2593645 RepID=UPI001C63FB31|nr:MULTISPECIES: thioesterase family protein [unclassified Chryseobacterium]MBW7674035.1 acyl-CoA thioesterase [Chryseobacterium sp. LJ756]MBW8523023.1 acyl-CoA thioesterase [Chryseobacterium sp. LJ668]QYK16552.1 acyl-CoA thioesterase [Chryseobacterium sp. LJ668]
MIHTTHTIRVRYAETDPMKYVYYGNYAAYFELGRVELFRSIGISYDEIEKLGIWLPVSDYNIKYLKPALYDQKLEIHTYVKKIPGVRIEFEYEIYNEEKIKITEARTTLFFLDAATNKVIKCPDFLMKLIEENWKEDQVKIS